MNKITQHPALLFAEDMQALCKPLYNHQIDYFAHVQVDSQGNFTALSSNPSFHQHYLEQRYYNADINMDQQGVFKHFVVWDFVRQTGKSAELYKVSCDFGVAHTFSIIEKGTHINNYYHFATSLLDESANQVYLNKLEELKRFILYFRANVQRHKQLRQAYNIAFKIDSTAGSFEYKDILSTHSQETDPSPILTIKKFYLNEEAALTYREIELLYWLSKGKTISEIAIILGIAETTINTYVAAIKQKAGVNTLFQLGVLYAEKFSRIVQINDA
ncbi:MAG: hypothetical protein Tsb005_16100 [Gammaproteobacteria bacterium]